MATIGTASNGGMERPVSLPWYDSRWLGKFLAASETIARVAPHKSEMFRRSFDCLRTDPGFAARKFDRLVAPHELDEIKHAAAAVPRDSFELHEMKHFGRIVVHDYPAFAELHAKFAALVSEWSGEEVEPAYNFLAMYTLRGICEPHLDAPSAKWTLDICIDQSEPWPIRFSQVVPWPEHGLDLHPDWKEQLKALDGLRYETVKLLPGDAVLFSGSSQWHYRDAMARQSSKSFCDLLFLHYIPKGAARIVEPGNWAARFDVPELADIPGIRRSELTTR